MDQEKERLTWDEYFTKMVLVSAENLLVKDYKLDVF